MANRWLKKAINPSHRGKLHEALGIPKDQKIPADKLEKAAKAEGKIGRMARLAKTMKGFH